jgi:spore coat polysaccharide biosynthesis protein SpsF (cytidylyltransferase family)
MTIRALVQARMSSARLPGKVLRVVAGKPLLAYVLERLQRCPALDGLVVATSSEASDDGVAALCDERGVACHRGALEDVAGRFATALEAFPCEAFVRVSGDSPLLDPALVARAVDTFRAGAFDLVTNVFPRSFPRGQSVEVVRTAAFRACLPLMTGPEDREHVTPALYRHAERFRIMNLPAERDWSGRRFVVDDAEDLERFAGLIAAMRRPHWEYGLAELAALVPPPLSGSRRG